jgi:hypothetical protein
MFSIDPPSIEYYEQKIPFVIHIINSLSDKKHLKELNPEYAIYIPEEKFSPEGFLREHFKDEKIFRAYDMVSNELYKEAILKLAIIYVHGGIIISSGCVFHEPFRSFVPPHTSIFFPVDCYTNRVGFLSDLIFGAVPKSPVICEILYEIVYLTLYSKYGIYDGEYFNQIGIGATINRLMKLGNFIITYSMLSLKFEIFTNVFLPQSELIEVVPGHKLYLGLFVDQQRNIITLRKKETGLKISSFQPEYSLIKKKYDFEVLWDNHILYTQEYNHPFNIQDEVQSPVKIIELSSLKNTLDEDYLKQLILTNDLNFVITDMYYFARVLVSYNLKTNSLVKINIRGMPQTIDNVNISLMIDGNKSFDIALNDQTLDFNNIQINIDNLQTFDGTYEQHIPKIIHILMNPWGFTLDEIEVLQTYQDLNPEYEFRFYEFNENEAENEFIQHDYLVKSHLNMKILKINISKFLYEKQSKLIYYAYQMVNSIYIKKDLFLLGLLDEYGGIALRLNFVPYCSFRQVIKPYDDFFCFDYNNLALFDLIGIVGGTMKMRKLIIDYTNKIFMKRYNFHSFDELRSSYLNESNAYEILPCAHFRESGLVYNYSLKKNIVYPFIYPYEPSSNNYTGIHFVRVFHPKDHYYISKNLYNNIHESYLFELCNTHSECDISLELLKEHDVKSLNESFRVVSKIIKKVGEFGETKQASKSSETKQVSDLDETKQPSELGETKQPSELGETKQPSELGETKQPSELGETKQPSELDETKQPSELDETKQASELGATKQPSELGETKQPSELSETKQVSDLGETKQVSDLGETKQVSDLGETKQPSELSETKQVSDLGETKQPSELSETKQLSDLGETKQVSDLDETKQVSDLGESNQYDVFIILVKKLNNTVGWTQDLKLVTVFQEKDYLLSLTEENSDDSDDSDDSEIEKQNVRYSFYLRDYQKSIIRRLKKEEIGKYLESTITLKINKNISWLIDTQNTIIQLYYHNLKPFNNPHTLKYGSIDYVHCFSSSNEQEYLIVDKYRQDLIFTPSHIYLSKSVNLQDDPNNSLYYASPIIGNVPNMEKKETVFPMFYQRINIRENKIIWEFRLITKDSEGKYILGPILKTNLKEKYIGYIFSSFYPIMLVSLNPLITYKLDKNYNVMYRDNDDKTWKTYSTVPYNFKIRSAPYTINGKFYFACTTTNEAKNNLIRFVETTKSFKITAYTFAPLFSDELETQELYSVTYDQIHKVWHLFLRFDRVYTYTISQDDLMEKMIQVL